MKTIWKFPFTEDYTVEALVPDQAEVLCAQLQGSVPCLWIRVDTEWPKVTRKFKIFGTGHDVPSDAKYVSTFQSPPFVWHVFEVFS